MDLEGGSWHHWILLAGCILSGLLEKLASSSWQHSHFDFFGNGWDVFGCCVDGKLLEEDSVFHDNHHLLHHYCRHSQNHFHRCLDQQQSAAARANAPVEEAHRPIEEEEVSQLDIVDDDDVYHGYDDDEEECVASETMDDVDDDEEEQKVDDEEEEQGGEMYWEQWCCQGVCLFISNCFLG